MIKKINKNNKVIRWGLIPFLLFLAWVAMTSWYIVTFDQSFLILSYNQKVNDFTSITHERLLKGQKLSGKFVAKENNLGIVALRFKSFPRILYKNEDSLEFRIKQSGQSSWYYQNNYRSGFTYDMPFLPFGFPVIPDSKGKTYIFELESFKGNSKNGVALSTRQPFFSTKYQANKAELLHNRQSLLIFGYKKFFNSFGTIDITYSSFVFLLPLLIYLFWISPIKSKIVDPSLHLLLQKIDGYSRRLLGKNYIYLQKFEKNIATYYLLILIYGVVLIDILFLQILNGLLYLSVGILWFFLMKAHKLDGQYSIIYGLILLCLSPIFLQFNITNIAEKAGAWAFIFIVVGFFQFIGAVRIREKVQM